MTKDSDSPRKCSYILKEIKELLKSIWACLAGPKLVEMEISFHPSMENHIRVVETFR